MKRVVFVVAGAIFVLLLSAWSCGPIEFNDPTPTAQAVVRETVAVPQTVVVVQTATSAPTDRPTATLAPTATLPPTVAPTATPVPTRAPSSGMPSGWIQVEAKNTAGQTLSFNHDNDGDPKMVFLTWGHVTASGIDLGTRVIRVTQDPAGEKVSTDNGWGKYQWQGAVALLTRLKNCAVPESNTVHHICCLCMNR